MKFLWALPAWLLLTASLVAPQVAYYQTGSVLVAIGAGIVPLALLGGVLLRVAPSRTVALVATGVAVAGAALTAYAGTAHFQQAAMLRAGRALDGVTMAEALQRGEEGTWVRITDARVRSEALHTLTFVSSSTDSKGRATSQTSTSSTLAPVTLVGEVRNEEPTMRGSLAGAKPLWACGADIWAIKSWDSERQAVRGTMRRIEPHVLAALERELRPATAITSPGAGAIPAAPNGAMPGFPVFANATLQAVAPQPDTLSVAADAWCIHLDRALDARSATEAAVGTALVLLGMLPLIGLLVLMIVVHGKFDF